LLIFMRPGTRLRIAGVLAFVLILLGVRAGITLYGSEEEAMAKITPQSRVKTSLSSVGLMVDVSEAPAEEISAALAALSAIDAKATWFVDATTVESSQDVVKEIAAAGHELGIKGTDHKAIDKLSEAEVRDRLLRARQALSRLDLGPAPFLYPPLGRYSDTVMAVAFSEGIGAVKPAHDASRMKGKEAEAAAKLAGSLEAGDFVLIRVEKKGLKPAAAYLEALVQSLAEKGLSMEPLSVLVKGVK